MRRLIPLNTVDGVALAVLSGYFKFYCATLFAGSYGTSGTCVIVVYEDYDWGIDHKESGEELRKGVVG